MSLCLVEHGGNLICSIDDHIAAVKVSIAKEKGSPAELGFDLALSEFSKYMHIVDLLRRGHCFPLDGVVAEIQKHMRVVRGRLERAALLRTYLHAPSWIAKGPLPHIAWSLMSVEYTILETPMAR